MSPSDKYLEQEAKAAEAKAKAAEQKIVEENKKIADETVYYFAPASNFHLGNFVKESRLQSGHIETTEQSLVWGENVLPTNDPDEIAYIESSKAFKRGTVKRCDSLAEVQALRMQRMSMKSIRKFETESVERPAGMPSNRG